MKKTVRRYLLLWVVCGFYAWGTEMAQFHYMDTHEWSILNNSSRDNVGICAFVFLGGPAGAFASAITTNFNQHGWELWWHR